MLEFSEIVTIAGITITDYVGTSTTIGFSTPENGHNTRTYVLKGKDATHVCPVAAGGVRAAPCSLVV